MYANKKSEASARTRHALEKAARGLFEARGFEAVSAQEIVAAAAVTRGALYHHYGGKEGLFEAVAEAAMRRLHDDISAAASEAPDPVAAIKLGARRFLELASEPRLQRVLFVDAPAVMGWRRWREMDERYGLGLLQRAVGAAMAGGHMARQPPSVVAHILLSSMIEAAMLVSRAEPKTVSREDVRAVLDQLIDGFARR